MPMSHVMGRGILYGTLGNGGTAYFAAKSDLSTLLEDLELVRPTEMNFVPRIWETLYGEYLRQVDRRSPTAPTAAVEPRSWTSMRQYQLGGRFIFAMTGSAPTSPELKTWVENLLDMHLLDGYGSTEAGMVLFDGEVQRPPVIDYKLADVPDLGYFATDRPYPRGELLLKTENMFPGYYKRPEITADVFDADGYYRTGDVVAEVAPNKVVYVDRRNNVLKLAQGEFVTVAKLEAVFGNSPLVRQIYVYGNSAHPYLLAVVVPTEEALARSSTPTRSSRRSPIRCRDVAKASRPAVLRGAARLHHRDNAFHAGERSADRHPQAGMAEAQAALRRATGTALRRPGRRARPTSCATLRRSGADAPVLQTVSRAAAALLGAGDHRPVTRRALHRLGRRLVVRVDIRQPAARDLRHRRAGRRHHQPGQRPGGHRRLHRGRAAGQQAADLRLGARA